ncbi:MAG: phosphoglycerate kinase [Candidatus Hodarchaeaceae archaeon]|nr:phosphoglycerate kinase [Candidatus Hodarchaeaceae archaeon]
MKFPTLDEVDVKGKTVLVRVDINSPIDPKTGEILDDTRIRECTQTLRELAHKGAKVVVMAHQGRPGDEDFTTLEKHAKKLSAALGLDVRYLPFALLGPMAIGTIHLMRPGEIILLENVRFLAEESLDRPPEELAKTHFVRRFAGIAQIYVNDAFGAAHRASASLVGFATLLPSYAGRLMERELKGLGRALEPEHPCVYVLGGAKVDDSLKIVENVLGKGIADYVLTGGLVGLTFLAAKGYDLGKPNLQLLLEKGYEKQIEKAKQLLGTHGDKIKMPVDGVVDDGGQAKELAIEQLPTELRIVDIGGKTIAEYSSIITSQAKTVVANGPMGIFEKPNFARGTFDVLKAMAGSQAFTIIGGGHMVAAAQAAGVAGQIKHVSTGGGACISFLSGERLPAVEALIRSKGTRQSGTST